MASEHSQAQELPLEAAVSALYHQLLEAWNKRSADGFANLFVTDGGVVGFDGSQMHGRAEIASVLGSIFADHATGACYGKVRNIRLLSLDVALLQAVGMIPAGQSDMNPTLNAVQTLVATRHAGSGTSLCFKPPQRRIMGDQRQPR